MKNDLCNRLFKFAVNVLKLSPKLPFTPEFKVIRYQLAKCSTSSGANYEESQAGSSRADFINKVTIALKEMRESNYWLRITRELLCENVSEELSFLVKESNELKKILGSIVTRSKSK